MFDLGVTLVYVLLLTQLMRAAHNTPSLFMEKLSKPIMAVLLVLSLIVFAYIAGNPVMISQVIGSIYPMSEITAEITLTALLFFTVLTLFLRSCYCEWWIQYRRTYSGIDRRK